MSVSEERLLLELAESIQPHRFREMTNLLGEQAPPLAILLATAFPPLLAGTPWQLDGLTRLARDGWRVPRRKSDYSKNLVAAAGRLDDPEGFRQHVRRAVWLEKARIALRELLPASLGGASVTATARELSALADAALEVTLSEACQHVTARVGEPRRKDGALAQMVVVGLGKLGGEELNAGSDVDIVFVYDTDEADGDLSLHDYWSRVARRIIAHFEEPSAEPPIWRVDTRLRPEGSRGALVNSVAATERYYETWGRLWERAAMLRARVCAGPTELGELLMRDVLLPFVFRREVDPGLVRGLAEMVERSRLELSREPSRDLKLGRGGIREAEFFVQSLQLIWGGQEPSLRKQGTLDALLRLRSRGLVTDREVRALADGYRHLRLVEHRIQWMHAHQTHSLPSDSERLEQLARSLGYAKSDGLLALLGDVRAGVQALFSSLSPGSLRPASPFRELIRVLDAGEGVDALARAAKGMLGGAEIAEHLLALSRRPDGLLGEVTRERHPGFAEQLLDAIAQSPDPEMAARYLRGFFDRFRSSGPYLTSIAQDDHARNRFVTALGASRFVSEAVIAHPDLADVVLFARPAAIDVERTLQSELGERGSKAGATLALRPGSVDAYDAQDHFTGAIRRVKRRLMVEVATADLAESLTIRETTVHLSELAERILARTVEFAAGGRVRGLSVVAMGKLGGGEIGYGSDLDVIFIFEPEQTPADTDAATHFVRLAQRVLRLISTAHSEGTGYELDTRLRPSGSQGMLVTSLASFAVYHGVMLDDSRAVVGRCEAKGGAAWERQALLRARAVAGDGELGAKVEAVAAAAAYEHDVPDVSELHRLRLRLQRELGRERAGYYDVKTGHGGLLDVEFAGQYLQMLHGRDPRVRTQNTTWALKALHAAGYLGQSHYETLLEGYAYLRRVEQRIHVLRGASDSTLNDSKPGLPQLARRLGYHERADSSAKDVLLASYAQVTQAVRRAYCEVLGVPVDAGA